MFGAGRHASAAHDARLVTLRLRHKAKRNLGLLKKLDAIDWARGQTEFATGAKRLDDGVHLILTADNGINGAGLDAQSAADTVFLNNSRNQWNRYRFEVIGEGGRWAV